MEKKEEEVKKVKTLVATTFGHIYPIVEDMTPKERMEYVADLRESEK